MGDLKRRERKRRHQRPRERSVLAPLPPPQAPADMGVRASSAADTSRGISPQSAPLRSTSTALRPATTQFMSADSFPFPPGTPVRVYARASTLLQEESVEQQLEVAERDLKACGLLAAGVTLPQSHAPSQGVFCDDGVSAFKVPLQERPASALLLADLERHPQPRERPGIIWVWAQSRLMRAEHGAAEVIAQLYALRCLGWVVLSHTDGLVDVIGDEGLLQTFKAGLNGAKDTAHSEEKQKAVRRAKDKQARRGVWLGGFPPLGYERWAVKLGPVDPATGLESIQEWVQPLPTGTRNGIHGTVTVPRETAHAALMRSIFACAADGEHGEIVSTYEIVRRLRAGEIGSELPAEKCWTHARVSELLQNETYIAVQRAPDGTPYPALWEPLISRAVWDRVQKRLAGNAQTRRGVNTPFALTGLLSCAVCHARFTGEQAVSRAGRTHRYYRSNAGLSGARHNERCQACLPRVHAEELEAQVLATITTLMEHPTVIDAIHAERAARRAGDETLAACEDRLAADAAEIQQQMDRLIAVLAQGGKFADRVQEKIASLNEAADRIERERSTLRTGTPQSTVQTFADGAAHASAVWAAASHAERKELLRCFVERVEIDVTRGTVRVGIRRVNPISLS